MTGRELLPMTRRGFLGSVGITAVVMALPGTAEALLPRPGAPAASFVLRRREDLLRIAVTPLGMTLNKSAGTITVDQNSPYVGPLGNPIGRLVVDIGPQSVLEEAFDLVTNGHPLPPARSRLAGSSRIVFSVPSTIQWTVEGVLAWAQYLHAPPVPAAYPDGTTIPENALGKGYVPPMPDQTCIEMPWWLIISPSLLTTWSEQPQAKAKAGRTEVFHTRAGQIRKDASPDEAATSIRGVWIRDPGASSMLATGGPTPAQGQEGYPFLMIPTPGDRASIVRLTTRTGNNSPGGLARAVRGRLALSPLGGQLDVIGAWDEPNVSSVMSWQQRIWQGRDTYAKIVKRGFLYPWGLRAYLVEEGIRMWRAGSDPAHGVRPFWFVKRRIGVTDPTITYAALASARDAGRRTALFRSVTCLTQLTPDLLPGGTPLSQHGWSGAQVFVPRVNGPGGAMPLQFAFLGIDANGAEVPFTMPLLFAEDKPNDRAFGARPNFTADGSADLRAYYATVPAAARRASFHGAPVGFAPNADPGATTFPVTSMLFEIAEVFPADATVRLISDNSALLMQQGVPRNMPLLSEAEALIEDLARITGTNVDSVLDFATAYVKSGLEDAANAGKVFLQNAAAQATKVAMDAAKAGGVIVPEMDLAGISSAVGAVYGTATELQNMAADGKITPGEALRAIQLLGGISLADILPADFPAVNGSGPTDKALSITAHVVDTGLPTERLVTTMAMHWKATELVPSGAALGLLDLDKATLELTLTSEIPTAGGKGSWSVRGSFNTFTVALVPISGAEFVYVDVARLVFTAGSGQAANVDVDIADVRFGAAMAFLAKLAEYLPFGDGLSIDVSAQGIKAGLSVELPSIGIGAFTLSGIAVNTGLTLPFTSDPVRFRFGMSAPDDPFGLTVMGLGGGGWFGNDLGLDGIEYLDVGAFVQAKVALDFGVASGSVAVQLGMQYAMGVPDGGTDEVCTLTAFVRIQGEVDILGIVSIGIEVYLGLGIDLPLPIPAAPSPGDVLQITVHGEASCTVKVTLFFFSKTVSFTVKRSFQGSDLPLADYVAGALSVRGSGTTGVTFADAMTKAQWAEYCGAFA